MVYLLLVSGAALVGGGCVLAAQARVIEAGLPMRRVALALLAAFALTHGASDWTEMAGLIEGATGRAGAAFLPTLHVVLLAGSFSLLIAFALTLLGAAPRRFSFAHGVAWAALAAWAAALVAALASSHGDRVASAALAEVVTRWVLGIPASVCAALGLLALAPSLALESWVESRLVRFAGYAFLLHGVADALGVLADSQHGPWPIDLGEVARHLSSPALELVETGAAASIMILLSEAFVFQTTQRLRREETHLRDDIIALVAHELGQPTAAVQLASERLELARRASRPVDARLSDDLRACANTLQRIVTDLLGTSCVHACELQISPTRVEVRPALERAAAVASTHAGSGSHVAVVCPDALPDVVADPARLDQILGNLLTNAVKYSALGSEVVVAAEATGESVAIRVVNEGPCIAPAEASRIFSRRYRASGAVRGAVPGLGLGLYVARSLVEAHGGEIWVESRDGRTAFCFTLDQAGVVAPVARRPDGVYPSVGG